MAWPTCRGPTLCPTGHKGGQPSCYPRANERIAKRTVTTEPSSLTFGITAHHEAGHAVMAMMLHRPFEAIEISSDGSGEFFPGHGPLVIPRGTCPQVGTEERAEAEARVLVYMGGVEAQRRYLVDLGFGYDDDQLERLMRTCSYDVEAAWEIADGVTATPAKADAFIDSLSLRAEGLWVLPSFWDDVETVAAVLREGGRLTEQEVLALVRAEEQG